MAPSVISRPRFFPEVAGSSLVHLACEELEMARKGLNPERDLGTTAHHRSEEWEDDPASRSFDDDEEEETFDDEEEEDDLDEDEDDDDLDEDDDEYEEEEEEEDDDF
ncbi:MAG TPA: hypothetical protein VN539_00875 [Candidatus Saccharimonadales bacterium]|nr:hypothetical protein [Candidatus Saccharimonadales bacterium]